MEEYKKEYLTLIQEPIGRLSTASAIFKGFVATIVTGLITLSCSNITQVSLIIVCIPILAFAALDIYYLQLERLYRGLYDAVLRGDHPVDFQMTLSRDKSFIKDSRASIWQCMTSPSIWLFYPAMFIVLIAISI